MWEQSQRVVVGEPTTFLFLNLVIILLNLHILYGTALVSVSMLSATYVYLSEICKAMQMSAKIFPFCIHLTHCPL